MMAARGAGIVGIVLAAGQGRRFDPAGARNKLLQALPAAVGAAPSDTVVEASARKLLAALPRVVAVVRPGAPDVADRLRSLGCDVTVCEGADSGMAASLVHGLGHARDAQGWLVALGDMPHVQPSTIAALLDALAQGADIAAPSHGGRRGNPVGFGRRHLPLLLALDGDQGARIILKNHPVNDVAVDDIGILHDIDTPDDLRAVRSEGDAKGRQ